MSAFPETRWSLIAATKDPASSKPALEELCKRYARPISIYLSRFDIPGMDRDDLVQDFMASILASGVFPNARRELGSFRAYLVSALRRHVARLLEKEQTHKRGHGWTAASMDELESKAGSEPTPEHEFERTWAREVAMRALSRLRDVFAEKGRSREFQLLEPFLLEEPQDGDYRRVADALGVRQNTIAVNVARLRQKFRDLVRAEVAETVASANELDQELKVLRSLT